MSESKGMIGSFHNGWRREHIDDTHYRNQKYPRYASDRTKEPIGHRGYVVGRENSLLEEAG